MEELGVVVHERDAGQQRCSLAVPIEIVTGVLCLVVKPLAKTVHGGEVVGASARWCA